MKKDQFIEVIKNERAVGFLTAVVENALGAMPPAYADNLIYELYAKRVYKGRVYTLTHKETGREIYFAGVADLNKYLKSVNHKYFPELMYRVQNNPDRSVYGYTVTYKETSVD